MWDAEARKVLILGFVQSFDATRYMHFLRLLRQRRGDGARALADMPLQRLLPPKGLKTPPSSLFVALVDRWIKFGPSAVADALDCALQVCGRGLDVRLRSYAERSAYLLPTSSPEPEDEEDDYEPTQVISKVIEPLGASSDVESEVTVGIGSEQIQAMLAAGGALGNADDTVPLPQTTGQDDTLQSGPKGADGTLDLNGGQQEEVDPWAGEATRVVDASMWSTVNLDAEKAKAPPIFLDEELTGEPTIGHLLETEGESQDTEFDALFLPDLNGPGDVTQQLSALSMGDVNAVPEVESALYLPHVKGSSEGLVELSFSGVPDGLHALMLMGRNLSMKGQISLEGLPGLRGFDGETPAGGLYALFNANEAAENVHRRLRYHHPNGFVGTPMALERGTMSSRSFAPELPQGAAWVPAGTYTLPGENEERVPTLCEDGFFLAQHPVTHADFERFVVATHYKPKEPTHYLRQAVDGRLPGGLADHPVVYVSYKDALAYAQWVGGRLPRVVELRRACTGLDGRYYPWGDSLDLKRVNTRERRVGWTLPVGSLPQGQGPFEHQDLLGNVWEWTGDIVGEVDPNHRAIMGGSWVNGASFADAWSQSQALETERAFFLGFRVAWDAPERAEKTAAGSR